MNMNQNTKQVTFEQIKQDPDIRTYIKKADESLIALGFTDTALPTWASWRRTAAIS